jgi:hypothetical protein
MAAAISIDPAGIYDDVALSELLGVSAETLARGRRSRELLYTRKGQRILYLGRWVVAWLEAGARREEVAHAAQ